MDFLRLLSPAGKKIFNHIILYTSGCKPGEEGLSWNAELQLAEYGIENPDCFI
jgi:hypothetical protein